MSVYTYLVIIKKKLMMRSGLKNTSVSQSRI